MNLFKYLKSLSEFKPINEDKLNISQTPEGYNELLIATDFYNNDKTIFVVTPTLYLAQKYYDDISNLVDNPDDVLFFPNDELISAEMISTSGDFLFERIETIYTLLKESSKKIVITNIHGAIKYEMSKEKWLDSIFDLEEGKTYDIKALTRKLDSIGYKHTFSTNTTGEYSRRGEIVDIFPLGFDKPVRIDFFDDEIETIKYFDTDTQRSNERVKKIMVMPVSEFIYNDKELEIAKYKLNEFKSQFELSQIEEDMYERDIEALTLHSDLSRMSRYLSLFDDTHTNIFSFSDNKKIYIIDPVGVKDSYMNLRSDLDEYCTRISGYSMEHLDLFMDVKEILSMANINIEGVKSMPSVDFSPNVKNIDNYNSNENKILNDLTGYRKAKTLLLPISRADRIKSFHEVLGEDIIFLRNVKDNQEISSGYYNYVFKFIPSINLIDSNVIIINDQTLFDIEHREKKAKYKSIYKNATKISHYEDLNIGDYVVHYDYGIGVYKGIKTLKSTGNIMRDYIYAEYANKSALYIPLEKFSDLMKYADKDTEGVICHEIGSAAWVRAKARVRNRLHDISSTLIKLYAERSEAKGFSFPPDSKEQIEFENDFPYEITPDQRRSIDECKRDMESDKPMDRLICGDVGYGKTEVALRLAFKAVMGGKQVAVLAPTTLLARQHYQTFKNRMENYGVRVELLSRFVKPKEQKVTIEDLNRGSVDVVIGTHRLLSQDIKYHNLGLLIVDEEQRFGVTHKEKIKELKVNVDCITLTATPIPRTLQMSMMGIKDLSMIETPPKNRYPIQTYIVERNDRIIANAISKELARGGQVFYLYNFTEDIMEVGAKIQSIVPEARIGIGHGKLKREDLEDVINGFIEKKFNVLLCTTIIETGIDMPDTNTLIVHDADRLGLSQMYQIRGRVGRSNKIAYAYLMYTPNKKLTPEAEKRLDTIKEFNSLGSGYQIAMRDLSIRGAGDILGSMQSGFVETVGMDVYLKILDEELHPKEEKKEVSDPSLSQPMVNRTISDTYINNDYERINMHKKIDNLNTISDLTDLELELVDRFGPIPDDLELYMYEKLMQHMAKAYGIYKIIKGTDTIRFVLNPEKNKYLNGLELFRLAYEAKLISLKEQMNQEIGLKEIVFTLDIRGNELKAFKTMCKYFEKIENI